MSAYRPSKFSVIESLAFASESELDRELSNLTDEEAHSILYDWHLNARPNQLQPLGDWLFWILLAGRGFGKTRVGAETVREWAEDPEERILLVGPTAKDVHETMVEGPSGLLACYPPERRPVWNSSDGEIKFPSGAIGITRAAIEPERLRGPQFRKFWFDEWCACRYAQEAWDQIMFGFRMPSAALRGVITNTPKPIKPLIEILKHPRCVVTRGTSDDNKANLSPEFIRTVIDPYRGTRLGRQEINAEILEDVPGALWTRSIIEETRGKQSDVRLDGIVRIVVAVDPAVTSNADSDETGIIVAALTRNWHVLILDDLSCRESPLGWARVAINAYRFRRADRIVAEVNNGGDLVIGNIRAIDPSASVRSVRASRGKYIRAEPVAALYEQHRVHHIGAFPALEDQMTGWTPQSGEKSPDRMDALVWAVTELLIDIDDAPMGVSPVGEFKISSI